MLPAARSSSTSVTVAGEVAEVYAQAAQEVTYVVPRSTASRARLTEVCSIAGLPAGLTRVAFTCGGSESV
jgi:hypothetical protein